MSWVPSLRAIIASYILSVNPLEIPTFLYKLNRPGHIRFCDIQTDTDNGWIQARYRQLPWGDHAYTLNLGPEGDFFKLRNQCAHIVLVFYPFIEKLHADSFEEHAKFWDRNWSKNNNVAKGGIVIFVSEFLGHPSGSQVHYWNGINQFLGPLRRDFDLVLPVQHRAIFRTETAGIVHNEGILLALQRKK